jgi:transposase
MPAEMSVDLKQHIVDWYLVDQYTYREIAGLANYSIGHVSHVMRNFREFDQVKNPFSSHTGHPSQIEGDISYLHALLEANPALYLDELQTRMLSVRNINLSIATFSRILAQYELTRKQLHKVAEERDEELRSIWEADMAQYQDPDVFVALDESAVDTRCCSAA